MPVEVKTVYTKEVLLRFQFFMATRRKFLWIFMGVCSTLIYGCLLWTSYLGIEVPTTKHCAIVITILDLLYIFLLLILPRFTVKKSKSLNTVVKYTFYEDHYQILTSNPYSSETATHQYTLLHHAEKRDSTLYLFITNHQAQIVDLAELPYKELCLLRQTLEANLSPKKVKWPA